MTNEQFDVLIDQIQAIRAKNNENWMGLVRIAFKRAPKEANSIMKDIVECDRQIHDLSVELSNEGGNSDVH